MIRKFNIATKTLYQLAFDYKPIKEICFNLEKKIFKNLDYRNDALYVTGLARSGTTTMLNSLHSTNLFASLTYRDMPFILSPNLWSKISTFKNNSKKFFLRAHSDGIKINYNSPEAFEEVFWELIINKDYISNNGLKLHNVTKKEIELLIKYQHLICHKYKKKRYLAKNNNLILRLESLANYSKDTKFIIMFRNPIYHSLSLLDQHIKFQKLEKFEFKYMKWLSHYEFGKSHLPFLLDNRKNKHHQLDVRYWLDQWIGYYSYLLKLKKKNS